MPQLFCSLFSLTNSGIVLMLLWRQIFCLSFSVSVVSFIYDSCAILYRYTQAHTCVHAHTCARARTHTQWPLSCKQRYIFRTVILFLHSDQSRMHKCTGETAILRFIFCFSKVLSSSHLCISHFQSMSVIEVRFLLYIIHTIRKKERCFGSFIASL